MVERERDELAPLEAEVAGTSTLVLRAAALADRMAQRPPSPTLPDNLRRLQDAVERGRAHVLDISRIEQDQHR